MTYRLILYNHHLVKTNIYSKSVVMKTRNNTRKLIISEYIIVKIELIKPTETDICFGSTEAINSLDNLGMLIPQKSTG